MNHKSMQHWICYSLVLTAAGLSAIQSFAAQAKDSYSYYHIDAAVISLDANHSLSSFRSGGKGSGTPGAQLGYSTPEVEITIALLVESNHFYADVTTRPLAKSDKAVEKKQRIDLTGLRPTSLDLGTDKNGRAYFLNLVPDIVSISLKPKSFQQVSDDLYRLQFHASRIVLNDKQYIGRMLASDAQVFNVDICGVASIEFSLRHLKGAEPWGRLQNGQITVTHPDGTTIEIGNVTNGTEKNLVEGGPYTVWVRWKKSEQTVEAYRKSLSEYRDQLKKGSVKNGTANTAAEALAVIEQELAREPGPWVTGCGACDLPKDQFVPEK
jgi:hypothetical protein